jgi:uncharacterized protein
MMRTLDNVDLLGAIVHAHRNHELVGRTRLQKTVYLLQRVGLPTDYQFEMYHYGPYSEELKDDVRLASSVGALDESGRVSSGGGEPYYIFRAAENVEVPRDLQRLQPLQPMLRTIIAQEDPTVLELAATYDAFREQGNDHEPALEALREMKGQKCEGGREDRALRLLRDLGLPTD